KLTAGRDVVRLPEEAAGELAQESTVIDLMQVLKERLQGSGKGESGQPGRGKAKDIQSGGGKAEGGQPGGGRRKAGDAAGQARQRRAAARSSRGEALEELSRDELYQRAQAVDIAGRSR